MLSRQPYTGWNDPMALTLYGRANRFNRAHFMEAASRLGLRDRATTRMIDAIVERAQEWPDHCAEMGFPQRQTKQLSDMLKARIATLK